MRGLSTQASAQRGNLLGIFGMVLAVAVSVVGLFGLEVGETARSTNHVLIVYGSALPSAAWSAPSSPRACR